MSIYDKTSDLVEEKDLGLTGWGSDCELGRNLYQYNSSSFFLVNNGKLNQYVGNPSNHYPVQTAKFFNVSNEEYFSHQQFTGITNNFVYFANQTTNRDNWTIEANILIQNVTNSQWESFIVNVKELLLAQGNFNATDEVFSNNNFTVLETSYYGLWMLNWGKLINQTFLITSNLETKANSIYNVDNKIEKNPIYYFSKILTNGKYLVSFSWDLLSNEISILNLETLKNYTISPSSLNPQIKYLITYNPVPVLVNNTLFIQSYPMDAIFKIDLDTNISTMFFNSTNNALTHFSILEPYIIITTLKMYNDITSFWLPIGMIFVSVTIVLIILFLLLKIKKLLSFRT